MEEYWVEGGEYTDTRFELLVEGADLENYGPYFAYSDAHRSWQAHTLATVDNACVRYRICQYAPGDANAPTGAA